MSSLFVKVKVKWHTTKYGDPYSEFVLCIWPIQSAHTQQWTHTHREHTPGAVGSHLCCGARGAVGGSVPCSRAPQSWYWGWRERCTFTSPHLQSCRPETRTRNLSMTSPTLYHYGPRLPPIFNSYVSFCFLLSFQPCVQYWPEPGLQQYGPMQVEFLSMSADEDIITRLFRVKNVTRVSSINDNLLSYI